MAELAFDDDQRHSFTARFGVKKISIGILMPAVLDASWSRGRPVRACREIQLL
jgi:hypothetical protein